jgi:riboflavin-specific deaminase-like protein
MADSDSPAWQLVRAAAAAARGGRPQVGHYALQDGSLAPVAADDASAVVAWDPGWRSLLAPADERQASLDLYLPFAAAHHPAPMVVGQLGQSIDGFIATASGHSHYVTGEAGILHLHRLRALSDSVIVGAGTVAADDPRLTTRRVRGGNPLRVVLDPQLRLPLTHRIFSDGEAPTLRVRASGVPLPAARTAAGVEDIQLPAAAGKLDLPALLAELRARGHRLVLVEGGGVTLSAFLAAGLLDRLHIVVAPFLMGEGRPGLRVPSPARLQDCLRPPPRVYALGSDVLFDCDLRADHTERDASGVIRRLL